MKQHNIWSFIKHINHAMFQPDFQISQELPHPLILESENDAFSFYDGDGFTLADQVKIDRMHLRVKNTVEKPIVMFAFDLSGRSIKLNEVKKHYPQLTITDIPRGRSVNEVTSYSTEKYPQGQHISFCFAEIAPDSLKTVVISKL